MRLEAWTRLGRIRDARGPRGHSAEVEVWGRAAWAGGLGAASRPSCVSVGSWFLGPAQQEVLDGLDHGATSCVTLMAQFLWVWTALEASSP